VTHAGIVDGIRSIPHSEIKAFKLCRREWYLRWYRGLRLKETTLSEKRHTGDRVHRALQEWYVPDGEDRVDPREGIELAIMEDCQILHDHLVATGWDQMPSKHPDHQKLMKANDLERIMVEGYMEWLAETGADTGLRIIAPEVFMEVTLPELENPAIRVVGKLDVRAVRISDGARVFIDHKTRDSAPQMAELLRDEQMLHYELLEECANPDSASYCDGAIFNVLRRVKRSATAKPPFYLRHFVPHNRHTKAAYRRRMVATIRDMIKAEEALDQGAHHFDVAYPNPGKDCGWRCPFASSCHMFDDGSDVERLLSDRYQRDDPMYYYGDSRSHAVTTGE
jgi:hypothetical protein